MINKLINKSWENIIDEQGEHLKSSNRSPFTLEDEAAVWIVRSGAVDVFFVEAENGEPVGKRQHLLRVEVGGALFSLSARETGYVLLAVGTPDTRLVRIPQATLRNLASANGHQDSLTPLVEDWVHGLSIALTRNVFPRPTIDVMLQGQSQTISGVNKILSTQREILWLGNIPAGSLYIGLEFLPERNCLFPLCPDTWLQMGVERTVETFPTTAALNRQELWDGLSAFHQIFLTCHTTNINLEKVDEHLKIKDTLEYRDKATRKALQSLARVIDATGEEIEAASQPEDPLAAACSIVTKAGKISFSLSSGFRSENYKDPLRELLHMARLRARKVTLKGEWWREDGGPLLAFTAAERRPVALVPVSPGKYNLIEPQKGIAVPVTKDSAASIGATAYTLYRTFQDQPLSLKKLLSFGLAFSRRDFIIVILTGLAVSGLGFLVPIFTGAIFDTVIPENSYTALYQILVALLISGVASGIFQFTRAVSALRVETRADVSLQSALWDRILKLPTSFFRNYTSGELAARAGGIESIRTILSVSTVTVLLSAVFSIFYLALMFYYSTSLALYVLALIVVAIIIMFILARYMLRVFRRAQQALQKLSGVIFQLITGVAKLRSSGAEPSAFALWANRFKELRLEQFRFRKLNIWATLLYSLLPILSTTLVYYVFSSQAQTGGLSTGTFLAFVTAASIIVTAVVSIGGLVPQLLNIIPIYENLKPVLQAPPEVDSQKMLSQELKGRIEIHQVSFRYRSDTPPALKDVSLQVEAGEHVALVGPSGSGKSTLVRLLLGFDKPDSGTIYYDGQDLSKLDVTSVRRQVGVVMQNSKLSSGTIYGNIISSFTELTERDVWEALRMVGMEEDIRQMPMGLNTLVSEGGSNLSGGQRQRLLLARAVVRKPRIVIMDEATSFLDNQTQEIVTQSLDKMKITRIIIAHRLSTVMHADTIYVIQNGSIAEKGSYQELIGKKGVFADLALRQMV